MYDAELQQSLNELKLGTYFIIYYGFGSILIRVSL